jgi:DNA-binding transcriptional LysR family regulator
MSEIETRLFRYFVAVADEQHFGRAALRLGITGPTLTHQIQKLESQLGTKLLSRKGNTGVVITNAGQDFLTHAREVLRQADEAASIARKAARGERGRLQIGFAASLYGAGMLRTWVTPFEEAHPAIRMAIHKLSPMAQLDGILRHELDAGFARAPLKYPSGLRGFDVFRQSLVLAVPGNHPLARHEKITPAMLADEPFVSFPTESAAEFPGHIEAIARLGNFEPRVVHREDEFLTVLSRVALGHGIAVIPEFMKTVDGPHVVFRNIAADPVPVTTMAFIYTINPSPPARLLIRHMQRFALRNGGKSGPPPNGDKPKAVLLPHEHFTPQSSFPRSHSAPKGPHPYPRRFSARRIGGYCRAVDRAADATKAGPIRHRGKPARSRGKSRH